MSKELLNKAADTLIDMAEAGTYDLDYECSFLSKVLRRTIGMLTMAQARDLLGWVYDVAILDSEGELAELESSTGWPEGSAQTLLDLFEEADRLAAGGLSGVRVVNLTPPAPANPDGVPADDQYNLQP